MSPVSMARGNQEPLLITAEEVVELLHVGRSTWYRHVSSGHTPAPVRLGRSVRWRRDELLAWVAAGCPPRSKWSMK